MGEKNKDGCCNGEQTKRWLALLAAGAALILLFWAVQRQVPPQAQPVASEKAPQVKEEAAGPVKLETLEDRFSYGVGLNLGRGAQSEEIDINPDLVLRGIRDGLTGVEPLLTDKDIEATMRELTQKMEQKLRAKLDELAKKNKEENARFFAENAKKKGVVTTASGLQYQVVKEGTGKQPGPEDIVTVHYVGTLLDGREFDSSRKRKEPVQFRLNGVIPGWVEGLQLMKEGGQIKLFVPPELAYGEAGVSALVGPNSALVFDVELIKVEAPPAEKKADDAEKAGETAAPAEAAANTDVKPAEAAAPAQDAKAEEAKPVAAPAEGAKAEEAKPAEVAAPEAAKAEETKPAAAPAEEVKAEEAKPAEAAAPEEAKAEETEPAAPAEEAKTEEAKPAEVAAPEAAKAEETQPAAAPAEEAKAEAAKPAAAAPEKAAE
ncbi:MAG: FKBP-type peptidyl-prolyl cis-trans isomerase [Deltaproteobacteria bacterium]|nr:FKBP-type peptidyl-prolyl cis-trans isomerase [Deltaproteobacteria bacterium]